MKIKLLSIVALLVCLVSTAYSDNMTPETLMKLSRISEFSVSPDGRTVLMTVTTQNIEANSSESQLYFISFSGGDMEQLTYQGKHNKNGCWSPDGKKIAFISDRDGKPQVFVMYLSGGDPVKMTNMENGVEFLSWSPDGKHLAFCSEVKQDQTAGEKNPDLPKVAARIYDKLPVRHWDSWTDEKYRHLFVIPATGGEPKDLMPGEKHDTPVKPFGGIRDISWSPKGTEIAYTAKKVENYAFTTNSDILVVSAYGGTSSNITQGMMGADFEPVYSPDGRWIAFLSQELEGFESDRIRLMLCNKSSNRVSELSKDLDQWVHNHIWAPNSNELYFSAGNGHGAEQLYSINHSGKFKVLTDDPVNHGDRGIDVSSDGKSLVFSKRSYNRETELYTISIATSQQKQLTDVNGDIFKNIKPVKAEERWIATADGKQMHCWIVYPPDFDRSKKYPMITYCQGGPQQAVSQYFSYGWNFLTMAGKGYVVLAPNRRGCPGFGQEWVNAVSKDYGGKAMDDILAATDELSKEPFIDKSRIAAVGGSAGGYAVFWLEGNGGGRFRAFISHCGMFDLVSKYGSTEELWFPNWDNGGPYWEPQFKAYYEKHSPHSYVKFWKTPILIITGEKDFRVPYTQSLEAFTAAQSQKIPSRLLVYPNENHWVLHPQEQVLWYREFFRFLDLFCN